MFRELNLDQTYDQCVAEGNILFQDNVDINIINSMLEIANQDLESARFLIKSKNPEWGSIYKLYYSGLHQLTQALLSFDKIKFQNSQCLFSYLCMKNPHLEFNWNFFEKIRTKINGINDSQLLIVKKDWIEISFQMELYIKTLFNTIELKKHELK